jgi:predicted nucleotidyltransferase
MKNTIFTYNNLKYKLLLIVNSGSRFYNTHYELGEHPLDKEYISDEDFKCVYIAQKNDKLIDIEYETEIHISEKEPDAYLLEFIGNLIGKKLKNNTDIIFYEISKFISLSVKNNPNILDILFTNQDNILFKDDIIDPLLNSKKEFLSALSKNSFSKYALSQLYKINTHYKMINQFPEVINVEQELINLYIHNIINLEFVEEFFGTDCGKILKNHKQKNKQTNVVIKTWIEFIDVFKDNNIYTCKTNMNNIVDTFNFYRKPFMVEFCETKDIKGQKLDLSSVIYLKEEEINITIRDFLLDYASIRPLNESVYSVFTVPKEENNKGIFTNSGKVKRRPAEHISDFLFTINIKKNNFKEKEDIVKKIWKWRLNRNSYRSILEIHFGYDTKHAAHLVRLLESADEIISTGSYTPNLSGNKLLFIKGILEGSMTYDELIKYSEDKVKELDSKYNDSTIRKEVNTIESNKILLSIALNF